MRETSTVLLDVSDELRRDFGQPLHVTAVLRVQHAARNLVADLPAVCDHFRALAQHFFGDLEILFEDWRRALFPGQLQTRLPTGQCQLARDFFRELDRFRGPVTHAEQRHG